MPAKRRSTIGARAAAAAADADAADARAAAADARAAAADADAATAAADAATAAADAATATAYAATDRLEDLDARIATNTAATVTVAAKLEVLICKIDAAAWLKGVDEKIAAAARFETDAGVKAAAAVADAVTGFNTSAAVGTSAAASAAAGAAVTAVSNSFRTGLHAGANDDEGRPRNGSCDRAATHWDAVCRGVAGTQRRDAALRAPLQIAKRLYDSIGEIPACTAPELKRLCRSAADAQAADADAQAADADARKTLAYYYIAAKTLDPPGAPMLVKRFTAGWHALACGGPKNMRKGVAIIAELADGGDSECHNFLAASYAGGFFGVERDHVRAGAHARASAMLGNVYGMQTHAITLSEGAASGGKESVSARQALKALRWFRWAAEEAAAEADDYVPGVDRVRIAKTIDRLESELGCPGCARQMPGAKMCKGCRALYYCGPDCQRLDWKAHKPLCREASGMAAAGRRYWHVRGRPLPAAPTEP